MVKKLHGIIAEETGRRGAISFARFMELALYCPNFGYYECLKATPGRTGDFFTSVSVGSLFGELLAFQCAEWLMAIRSGPPRIVEAGAHDGRLAADILRWMRAYHPEISKALEYWIIEP